MNMAGVFSRMAKPVLLLVVIALTAGGIWLLRYGYDNVKTLWQLQRLPVTPVSALLPGEVLAEGSVVALPGTPDGRLLTSESGQQKVVYFRYLHEKQIGTQDNKRWTTVKDIRESVNFQMHDGSDLVTVNTHADAGQVDWSLPATSTRTEGDHRYREWTLKPGDQVTILGWYQSRQGEAEINFKQASQQQPFISSFGIEHEIQARGHGGIFKIWCGLVLLGIAVYLFCYVLGIHRILVCLAMLSLTYVLALLALGLHVSYQDLREVQTRVVQQLADAEQEIAYLAQYQAHRWQGLDSPSAFTELGELAAEHQRRLDNIKLGLEGSLSQARRQFGQFPANVLSAVWAIHIPVPAALSLSPGDTGDNYQGSFELASVPLWQWVLFAASSGLALLFTVKGLRAVRVKRWIENIPFTKASGVVWGVNELNGEIASLADGELETPLSKQPCVWFDYRVYERRQSNNKKQWKLVERQSDGRDFLLTDDSGSVLVNARGAAISAQHRVRERHGKRKVIESSLRAGDQIYLLGSAELSGRDDYLLRLSGTESESPFIISRLSEADLLLRRARKGMVLLLLACNALMLAGLFFGSLTGNFSALNFLLTAVIATGYLLLLMLIMHYNDLVFLKHRVERALANIDVALQKRFDLAGNLLSVVQHYAAHEQDLMADMTSFRNQHRASAGDQSLNDRLQEILQGAQRLLPQLKVVAENYPGLKQQELIQSFTEGLTRLEDEVSLMKEGYNNALEVYLTRLQTFPDVLLAKLFRFKKVGFGRLE